MVAFVVGEDGADGGVQVEIEIRVVRGEGGEGKRGMSEIIRGEEQDGLPICVGFGVCSCGRWDVVRFTL